MKFTGLVWGLSKVYKDDRGEEEEEREKMQPTVTKFFTISQFLSLEL